MDAIDICRFLKARKLRKRGHIAKALEEYFLSSAKEVGLRQETADKLTIMWREKYVAAKTECDRLLVDNVRKNEALKFYADVNKYPAPLTGGMGALWKDCGQVARSALTPKNKKVN